MRLVRRTHHVARNLHVEHQRRQVLTRRRDRALRHLSWQVAQQRGDCRLDGKLHLGGRAVDKVLDELGRLRPADLLVKPVHRLRQITQLFRLLVPIRLLAIIRKLCSRTQHRRAHDGSSWMSLDGHRWERRLHEPCCHRHKHLDVQHGEQASTQSRHTDTPLAAAATCCTPPVRPFLHEIAPGSPSASVYRTVVRSYRYWQPVQKAAALSDKNAHAHAGRDRSYPNVQVVARRAAPQHSRAPRARVPPAACSSRWRGRRSAPRAGRPAVSCSDWRASRRRE